MVMTVTARRVVIRNDDVRTQQSNLQHHASQQLLLTPCAKRLFSRLRKTEIAKAEEVRLGALHFGGRHRLARADHAELFVELGTDGVLPAFNKRGEKRDGVDSVLAAKDRQCAAVFVVG